MDLGLELLLLVGQQVDLDVGIGGAAHVQGRQVLGLDNRHRQAVGVEVVFQLERNQSSGFNETLGTNNKWFIYLNILLQNLLKVRKRLLQKCCDKRQRLQNNYLLFKKSKLRINNVSRKVAAVGFSNNSLS